MATRQAIESDRLQILWRMLKDVTSQTYSCSLTQTRAYTRTLMPTRTITALWTEDGIFNRVDKRFAHVVDQERGPRSPSVEVLHSPANAKTGNGNGHSDYTDSVGCKGVGCSLQAPCVRYPHLQMLDRVKKQRHGEILAALATRAPVPCRSSTLQPDHAQLL